MVILLKVSCLPLPFAFLLVLFGEKVETRPYFVSELSSHSLQSSCFKVLSTEDKRYGLPCLTSVVCEVYILFYFKFMCMSLLPLWVSCTCLVHAEVRKGWQIPRHWRELPCGYYRRLNLSPLEDTQCC